MPDKISGEGRNRKREGECFMMGQPSLDELMKKADSRYTLVVMAARRARILTEKGDEGIIASGDKPVTVALQEVGKDKIRFKRRSIKD